MATLMRKKFQRPNPEMPHAKQTDRDSLDSYTARTISKEVDPPHIRLKDFQRRQVAVLNLSTERSLNVSQSLHNQNASKKKLYPKPLTREQIGLFTSRQRTQQSQQAYYNLLTQRNEQANKNNSQQYSGETPSPQQKNSNNQSTHMKSQERMGTNENAAEDDLVMLENEIYQLGDRVGQQEDMLAPKNKKFANDHPNSSGRLQSQSLKQLYHYKPTTEAELRMEYKYIQNRANELKVIREEQEVLDLIHDYRLQKTKIVKMSMAKVQRKRAPKRKPRLDEISGEVALKKEAQENTQNRPAKSMSLPQIKVKNVDTTLLNAPVLAKTGAQIVQGYGSRREDVAAMRMQYGSKIKASQIEMNSNYVRSLVKESLSGAKMYFAENRHVTSDELEENMQMLRQVQEAFRRKGIAFDPASVKKAILTGMIQQEKTNEQVGGFPAPNLVSNPIYRRWGI